MSLSIRAALRIVGDVAVYRLRRLEMANLGGAVTIGLVLGLAPGDLALRVAVAVVLNLLVYLNREWQPSWGGGVEIWDREVQKRYAVFEPKHNRAVFFETSELSFHGVQDCTCPSGVTRNSFAVYYYTEQAPAGYAGVAHSTIFKARPDERLKKYVLMPAEALLGDQRHRIRRATERLARLMGRG